jgi:hypothetical protein
VTTDELIANITLRASLPTFQNTWTTASLIAAMNEEMRTHLYPTLVAVREDYFLDFLDVPLVANQRFYDFPARSPDAVIEKLCYVDATGVEFKPMKRISNNEIFDYFVNPSNPPTLFYFMSEQIGVLPVPASGITGALRMYYPRQPGALVSATPDAAGQSQAVGVVASVLSDTQVRLTLPTNGWAAGKKIDFMSSQPPFKMYAKDFACTAGAAGSTDLTFAAGGITALNLQAGDFLTLAQTSFVPQMPLSWHSLLELRVGARVLDSLGDQMGSKGLLGEGDTMHSRLLQVVTPRAKSNVYKFNAWRR